MNTVDGSPFSKNDFLSNVSKKLLPLFGLVASKIALVGRYGLAVEALSCTHNIFFLYEII